MHYSVKNFDYRPSSDGIRFQNLCFLSSSLLSSPYEPLVNKLFNKLQGRCNRIWDSMIVVIGDIVFCPIFRVSEGSLITKVLKQEIGLNMGTSRITIVSFCWQRH